jgi:hypothetical protein
MKADLSAIFEGTYWHQKWEVAPGIFTPGHNPVIDLMKWTNVPVDLTGKRVLDIGAWNGCFSFECERRNAAEILAIGPEPSTETGFDKLKAFLKSNVIYQQRSIYNLHPDVLGKYNSLLQLTRDDARLADMVIREEHTNFLNLIGINVLEQALLAADQSPA